MGCVTYRHCPVVNHNYDDFFIARGCKDVLKLFCILRDVFPFMQSVMQISVIVAVCFKDRTILFFSTIVTVIVSCKIKSYRCVGR